MAITVLYGPMATGKTLHAETFRKLFGAKRIRDDWPHNRELGKPANGDLLITNLSPDQIKRKLPGGGTLVSIEEARRRTGLPPAPKNGFFA